MRGRSCQSGGGVGNRRSTTICLVELIVILLLADNECLATKESILKSTCGDLKPLNAVALSLWAR